MLFIEGALFASKEKKNQKEWLRFSLLGRNEGKKNLNGVSLFFLSAICMLAAVE